MFIFFNGIWILLRIENSTAYVLAREDLRVLLLNNCSMKSSHRWQLVAFLEFASLKLHFFFFLNTYVFQLTIWIEAEGSSHLFLTAYYRIVLSWSVLRGNGKSQYPNKLCPRIYTSFSQSLLLLELLLIQHEHC